MGLHMFIAALVVGSATLSDDMDSSWVRVSKFMEMVPRSKREYVSLLPGFMFPLGFYNGVSALLLLKCVFMMLLFFDSIYFRQGTDRADRVQHQLYQIGGFLHTK